MASIQASVSCCGTHVLGGDKPAHSTWVVHKLPPPRGYASSHPAPFHHGKAHPASPSEYEAQVADKMKTLANESRSLPTGSTQHASIALTEAIVEFKMKFPGYWHTLSALDLYDRFHLFSLTSDRIQPEVFNTVIFTLLFNHIRSNQDALDLVEKLLSVFDIWDQQLTEADKRIVGNRMGQKRDILLRLAQDIRTGQLDPSQTTW